MPTRRHLLESGTTHRQLTLEEALVPVVAADHLLFSDELTCVLAVLLEVRSPRASVLMQFSWLPYTDPLVQYLDGTCSIHVRAFRRRAVLTRMIRPAPHEVSVAITWRFRLSNLRQLLIILFIIIGLRTAARDS